MLLPVTAAIVFHDRQPAYQGQTLIHWVTMRPRNLDERLRKRVAINKIGTNAIPCLVKWIRHERPPWTRAFERLWLKMGLPRTWLPTLQLRLRADAVPPIFALLGTNAAPAVPMLGHLAAGNPKTETAGRARVCINLILSIAQDSTLETTKPCPLLADALLSTNAIIREQATLLMRYYTSQDREEITPDTPSPTALTNRPD